MSKESIRDLTIKALKSALEVNSMEWISVKNRLPQKNKGVLMVRNGSVEIGFYNAKDARFCVPNENAFDGWPIPVDDITHWMPLPEPPTK